MTKINQKLLDEMAVLEVEAILRALKDGDVCNPAWVARARALLKDNRMETTPETEGLREIKERLKPYNESGVKLETPIFDMPHSEQ